MKVCMLIGLVGGIWLGSKMGIATNGGAFNGWLLFGIIGLIIGWLGCPFGKSKN